MASPNPKQLKQSPPHPLRSAAFPPCGLLYLPVESLLEILSYFPVISLPRVNGAYDPSVKSTCYTRTDALCALSQTCRALRRTFLQQRWERLDVYARECRRQHTADEQVSKGLVWYKQVAMDLKAKSRGLARNKQLAAYVRTCHVVLTRCSAQTTLPAFVRCLPLLTNLHTLEILHAHAQITTTLKTAFAGHTFPAIRTVILPSCAHHILPSCPEVRTVICTEDDGSAIIGAIAQGCSKVEVLEGILPNAARLKRLAKAAPNMHRLRLRSPLFLTILLQTDDRLTPDVLRILAPLTKLSYLEFPLFHREVVPDNSAACIHVAGGLLRGPGPKQLRVHHYDVVLGQISWLRTEDIMIE